MSDETMIVIQSINHIAISPTVRSGRAHVVGTTITVADVAMAKVFHEQDVDGIASWYGLTLPQVYSALAYYYDHKVEIDRRPDRSSDQARRSPPRSASRQ